MPDGGFDPARLAPAVERVDYTVKKGEVSLAVYRKRAAGEGRRPVLFLVHGSSNSALSSFDLSSPDEKIRKKYNSACFPDGPQWTSTQADKYTMKILRIPLAVAFAASLMMSACCPPSLPSQKISSMTAETLSGRMRCWKLAKRCRTIRCTEPQRCCGAIRWSVCADRTIS